MAQLWDIVGGSGTGGLLVRSGESTASAQLPARLGTESLVRQLDLKGDRLHYEPVAGSGPQSGWISIRLKGKDLAVKSSPLPSSDTDAGSKGERESGKKAGSSAWNPYAILGVPPDAPDGNIRSAYRKMSLKVHPDRMPDNDDAADQFRALTDAKDFLLDPRKRRMYNLKHGLHKHTIITKWWSTWAQVFEEVDTDLELQGDHLPSSPEVRDSGTDLLIFGATGLIGTLACSLLYRLQGRTWAVVGRDAEKLQAIEDKFKNSSFFRGATLLQSDSDVAQLVQSARVVVDFSGPKFEVGFGTAEACASAGVHYIEITGDPKNVIAVRKAQSKLDELARESGAALIFFCGYSSVVFDIGTWQIVKHMRDTFDLETWKVDNYEYRSGPVNGTYMYSWCKRPALSEVVKLHGGPFVLGGKRACGVRAEEEFDAQVIHDDLSGLWRMGGADGFNDWIVRASCGLHDDIQPYGENFIFRTWLLGPDKKEMENSMVTDSFLKLYYDQYVAEDKLPPIGSGPREHIRRGSVAAHVFVATAVDHEAGMERHAYGLLTAGPGGAGDLCEGSAICALEAAQCILDALDGGHSVRTGFGTPAYHLAHLGYSQRLLGQGFTWKAVDGLPPKELFENMFGGQEVKSLSA